jgi:hypothetical protein
MMTNLSLGHGGKAGGPTLNLALYRRSLACLPSNATELLVNGRMVNLALCHRPATIEPGTLSATGWPHYNHEPGWHPVGRPHHDGEPGTLLGGELLTGTLAPRTPD